MLPYLEKKMFGDRIKLRILRWYFILDCPVEPQMGSHIEGMRHEAEIGVTRPQAKERWYQQMLEEARNRPPRGSGQSMAPLIAWQQWFQCWIYKKPPEL